MTNNVRPQLSLNIGSASILLFALLIYLLTVGFKTKNDLACIVTSLIIIMSSILVVYLVLTSFKKRKSLINTFTRQYNEKID